VVEHFLQSTIMSEHSPSEIQLDGVATEWTLPELRRAICEVTSQLCPRWCGGELRAIVLTGSLARDEATFVREGEKWKLLGDAEFLLIFKETGILPSSSTIELLGGEVEQCLLKRGLAGHVELSPVSSRYLRKMVPEIFAHELRTHGQVVWGEHQVLSLIPAFSISDIPLEDGWRMLCNRTLELLEVVNQLIDRPTNLPRDARYRVIKLYLDMATSFLLFQGEYTSTYRQRAERLRVLVESTPSRKGCPFASLRSFADRVASCTESKLHATTGVDQPGTGQQSVAALFSLDDLSSYVRLLWRWELERLTGKKDELSDRELMRRWMQLQPVHTRFRGWASALRRSRWHRSWRYWPHWLKLGWRASPRYWVYAAACELLFRLPSILNGSGRSPEVDLVLQEVKSWLPVARDRRGNGAGLSWRQVAADIAWNYHAFLVGTRS
jgi:hypothetical protein